MKSKKIIACAVSLAAIAILLTSFIKADDDPIKKIVTQFNKWVSDYPSEKVYLHLDKPYYAAGESIWFKAYVTINDHQLSALSGVLNVELINEDDSVKQAIKIPLANGLGSGDFSLPDTLQQGNYRVRAYTNWMRNAGDDYFFDKTIYIGNAIDNKVFTKATYQYSTENGQQKVNAVINYANLDGSPYTGKEVSYEVQFGGRNLTRGKGVTDDKGNINVIFFNKLPLKYSAGHLITRIKINGKDPVVKMLAVKAAAEKADVQFFPESGNLVIGIRSRVAFKAVGADGLGADIKGLVSDNEGNQVAQFSSRHLGMGVFALMPQSGKSYKVTLTYADGTQSIFDLPKAVDNGYVLSINSTSDSDKINIKISTSLVPAQDSQITGVNLVAQSGGTICYAAKSKITGTSLVASIPKKLFPTGIAQFTLFSDAGEPLCERIAFIKNHDQLKLNITSPKNSYAPRGHMQLEVNAADKDGKPVTGSFSAAVIDESKVKTDEDAESTILSTLLLTSDLKGYIEKPNYYFTNDKSGEDLDILMMTQGYRRFEWKQIMNDVFPPVAFKPEKTIDISGHIKTLGGKPVAGGKVTLFTTVGGTFLLDTVSDEKGNFIFKDLVFKDSVRFVIQARTAKDRKNVEIDLDNITPQPVSKNKNAPDIQVSVNDVVNNYLQNSKKKFNEDIKYGVGNHVRSLKEVIIKDKKPPLPNSYNLNGPGNADQVIKGDQVFQGCPRLVDCLQGRLLGVVFRNGVPYSTRSPNIKMGIVIDGVQFDDPDFLNNIEPSNIESVEVLRSGAYTAIYGSRGAGGILLINTKHGASYSYQRYTPGIITYSPKGYYAARTFYAPRYDDPKTNTEISDLRTTILWKPDIITDKDGKTTLDFFNADSKGTYRVVIEGIDGEGNLGRQVYRYKVE